MLSTIPMHLCVKLLMPCICAMLSVLTPTQASCISKYHFGHGRMSLRIAGSLCCCTVCEVVKADQGIMSILALLLLFHGVTLKHSNFKQIPTNRHIDMPLSMHIHEVRCCLTYKQTDRMTNQLPKPSCVRALRVNYKLCCPRQFVAY